MSGYKVRPTKPLIPPPDNIVKNECIGRPPIPLQPKVEDVDPTRSDGNSSELEDDQHDQVEGGGRGVQESKRESPNESNINPDQPHWRGRKCDLLNNDMSFFGRAKIVVCLPDEPFDEENLGDTDAGVLFLLNGDLQMTSFRWPLAQVRLEGGRLLSEIVTWCSEHAKSSGDDSGLKGLSKNPNRYVKRWKLSMLVESKLKRKSSNTEVQKVSSLRCCKYRCTQTFSWEDTLAVRRKFYRSTFKFRREIVYAVQGQLHELPERRKKFITLSNRKVCENAWYIIHGVFRSAYYKYKAAAHAGRVNGTHGNSRIPRPHAHTI